MRFQDLGKRGVLQKIDPTLIVEEPGWNARKEGPALQAHIETLASSIKAIGVQEPLTVYMRGDEVVLVNGHCRLAAIRLLMAQGEEIRSVPCCTEQVGSNDADRVLAMITRNSGKPLEPIELAEVMKRLLAFGWSEQEIATKTGFSEGYVIHLLKLLEAPEEVKQMVRKGEVSASTAANVVKHHGTKAAEVLRDGLETAKAQGKAKVTPRHLPKPEPSPAAPVPLTDQDRMAQMQERITTLESWVQRVLDEVPASALPGDLPLDILETTR